MGKAILMEEYHVSIFAPRGLSLAEYDAIHMILNAATFQLQLRRAIRSVVRRHPELSRVRVRLSR